MNGQVRLKMARHGECRLCDGRGLVTVVDLGAAPQCERLLTADQLGDPEVNYPLHLKVCPSCWLVQIPALITPAKTSTEHPQSSSCSTSWEEYAKKFAHQAVERLHLGLDSFVVEVTGIDVYLLQQVTEQGIRWLPLELSHNAVANVAEHGIRTRAAFLDAATGDAIRMRHGPADLVVANNVYARIPDIVGFTEGLRALVADDGWVCIEVPYLLSLLESNQYDTISHQWFQYYTAASARRALATGGLSLVDVELLQPHRGSIRLWARPSEATDGSLSAPMTQVLEREVAASIFELSAYSEFAQRVAAIRRDLLRFLVDAAELGKTVVGYGAPGRGNTLLNHCGVRPDLMKYTVDCDPHRYGKYTPGTRIPIVRTEQIAQDRPDYVLVLPWSRRTEISTQLAYVHGWGGRLVFPLPSLDVVAE